MPISNILTLLRIKYTKSSGMPSFLLKIHAESPRVFPQTFTSQASFEKISYINQSISRVIRFELLGGFGNTHDSGH